MSLVAEDREYDTKTPVVLPSGITNFKQALLQSDNGYAIAALIFVAQSKSRSRR